MLSTKPANHYSEARKLLASTLYEIGQGPSFWFVVNQGPSSSCSLASPLGFHTETNYHAYLVATGLAEYVGVQGTKKLRLARTEWEIFLKETGLAPEVAEFKIRRIDIQAVLSGVKQDFTNRKECPVLHLGQKSSPSYQRNITLQKDDKGSFLKKPPVHPGLRSIQRKFSRLNQQIIADTIIDNDDIYAEATTISGAQFFVSSNIILERLHLRQRGR